VCVGVFSTIAATSAREEYVMRPFNFYHTPSATAAWAQCFTRIELAGRSLCKSPTPRHSRMPVWTSRSSAHPGLREHILTHIYGEDYTDTHTHTYTYTHTHTHTNKHTHAYTHTHTHTHRHTVTYTYTHIHTPGTCTHTRISTQTHMRFHVYTHAHTHIHTHTTHTHTHTCTCTRT
jgi:hypothetical protein